MLNADGRKLHLLKMHLYNLTLLHSERPNLYTILAFLSAVGLISMSNADGRKLLPLKMHWYNLTLLHSERPKLYTILAFLSAVGLISMSNADGRKLLPLKMHWYNNPIALRKAKIVYNFGLSECSRINIHVECRW